MGNIADVDDNEVAASIDGAGECSDSNDLWDLHIGLANASTRALLASAIQRCDKSSTVTVVIADVCLVIVTFVASAVRSSFVEDDVDGFNNESFDGMFDNGDDIDGNLDDDCDNDDPDDKASAGICNGTSFDENRSSDNDNIDCRVS